MDKQLITMWLGWHRRAEKAKRDAKKSDADIAADLYEILGYELSRPLVNAWFKGRRIPDLNEFMALCQVLGADPGEILFGIKISHLALLSSPAAKKALEVKGHTPEYLVKHAQRIRAFKAKRRKIKLPR